MPTGANRPGAASLAADERRRPDTSAVAGHEDLAARCVGWYRDALRAVRHAHVAETACWRRSDKGGNAPALAVVGGDINAGPRRQHHRAARGTGERGGETRGRPESDTSPMGAIPR